MSATESLLVALIALAAYRLLARWPDAARLAAAPLLLVFAYAGLTFPDVDQPLPLDHRSALTHSALPLALARWRFARAAAAGLAIGIGVHLAADLFPERMTGYALVKVPFGGTLDSTASYLWLFANAAFCTWTGARLLRSTVPHLRTRAVLLVATLGLAAWYLIVREGSVLALLLYAMLAWLTLRRAA